VAKVVADVIKKNSVKWTSPITFCLSIVSKNPQREISLVSEYKYGPNGETDFASTETDEDWKHNTLGRV